MTPTSDRHRSPPNASRAGEEDAGSTHPPTHSGGGGPRGAHDASPLQHIDAAQGDVRADRPQCGQALRLRSDRLRLRPYRQRQAGHRVRRAVPPAAHVYGADHVIYVRNITDVDDKINARAARDYPGLPLNEAIAKVTETTERQFHADVAALGCLPPTEEPRATQYIEKMRAMIERLVARGVAYVAEDHVLFSPSAMDRLPGAPRYGTLAHRSLDEMLAGARVDVAPYKRDPMDFVLWKPSKPNEPSWPSPAGIAAPGARLAYRMLGDVDGDAARAVRRRPRMRRPEPQCVRHSRRRDRPRLSPPRERDRAVLLCLRHSARMANVWMHNGFLQVEGEKMSKSLGNFVTIHELLHTTKFGGRNGPARFCGSRCYARTIASRSTGR
jgi:hypothetical protein